MTEHTVTIGGKSYEVSVIQLSKTVWRATGQFYGQYIETKGRSPTQALGHWRSAAAAEYQRQ